ncbi:hypothetical protein SNEBB_004325 [Seison nebaliae]|nr:hypothetical protein SNEBB_004325 [Seison nebaliae]
MSSNKKEVEPPNTSNLGGNAVENMENVLLKMKLLHTMGDGNNFKFQQVFGADTDTLQYNHKEMLERFDEKLKETTEIDFDILQEILTELKKLLIEVVHKKEKEEIEENLNIEKFIENLRYREVDVGVMVMEILDICARNCNWERDSTIKELKKSLDSLTLIEIIKKLFQLIQQMNFDLLNAEVQAVQPHLKAQMVAVEKEEFAKLTVNAGRVTRAPLQHTGAWLDNAYCRLMCGESINGTTMKKMNKPRNRIAEDPKIFELNLDNIFCESIQELFLWDDNVTYAEILEINGRKFQNLALRALKLVLTMTITSRVQSIFENFVRIITEDLSPSDKSERLSARLSQQQRVVQYRKELEKFVRKDCAALLDEGLNLSMNCRRKKKYDEKIKDCVKSVQMKCEELMTKLFMEEQTFVKCEENRFQFILMKMTGVVEDQFARFYLLDEDDSFWYCMNILLELLRNAYLAKGKNFSPNLHAAYSVFKEEMLELAHEYLSLMEYLMAVYREYIEQIVKDLKKT